MSNETFDSHIQEMNLFLHCLINHAVAGRLVISELRNSQIETLASLVPVATAADSSLVVKSADTNTNINMKALASKDSDASDKKTESISPLFPLIVQVEDGGVLQAGVV